MPRKFKPSQGGGAGNKIVRTGDEMGVKGLQKMQGTTRAIFDSQLIVASGVPQTYTFFQNVNTRQFPLTNLQENKLQVGESLAVQRLSVFVMTATQATNPVAIRSIVPLDTIQNYQMAYGGLFSLNFAQNQVIKEMPLTMMQANFNKDARFMGYYQTQPAAADPVTSYRYPQDVFKFDNDLVILPQIQFYVTIQMPAIPAVVAGIDSYFCVRLSGLGSLFSPKGNF